MALRDILNLSQPRLVVAVVVGSAAVVGLALQALRYHPQPFDACAGVAIAPATGEGGEFERVTEVYLKQTRNWSLGDYCIDENVTAGNERRVSVLRRGMLVGGGEGFRVRIDPVSMNVKGELPHQ